MVLTNRQGQPIGQDAIAAHERFTDAIEAAAKHIYEDKGDRKGVLYVGWENEPESVRESWRVDVREAVRAYEQAMRGERS